MVPSVLTLHVSTSFLTILLIFFYNFPKCTVTSSWTLFLPLSHNPFISILKNLLKTDLHKENIVMTLTYKKKSQIWKSTTTFIPGHPLACHPDSMSITSLAQKSCLLCPYCTVGSHAYLQICSHPSITIHSCIHPHLSLPHSGHSQCYLIPLHDPWAARGQQGLFCFWNSELCPLPTGLLNYLIFSKTCVCSP